MEESNKVRLNIQSVLAFLTFVILLISITLYVSGHGFLSGYFSVLGSHLGLFEISLEQFFFYGGIGILQKTFYIYFGSAALIVFLILSSITFSKIKQLFFKNLNLFSFQDTTNSEKFMDSKVVSFFMNILLMAIFLTLPFVFLGFVLGASTMKGREQAYETIDKYNENISLQGGKSIPVIGGGKINPPIEGIQDICFGDTCVVYQGGGVSKTVNIDTGVVITSHVLKKIN